MPKPVSLRPTPAELAILRVLWLRGPSTVRQVQEELGENTGYTTALKLMQIMCEKGLLLRDDSARVHIFRPAHPAHKTQSHLVRDLIDRAFHGSAMKLVLRALSEKKATPKELAELRRWLDENEKESK